MKYTIIGGNKRQYRLLGEDGSLAQAHPRKTFLASTNGLYVGDHVTLDKEGCIDSLLERANLLYRPKIANIDYMCVVASLKVPDFSSFLLDKFLTYLEYQNIKAVIVFVKADLLNLEERAKIEEYATYYRSLGYKCFITSKYDKEEVEKLKELIKGKTVAFMGQTGAGKSSLINAIDPSIKRLIGEYSEALGRGKHKTKEVVLIQALGGLVGDTPGFSSLHLNFTKVDASHYFPGFAPYFGGCYFNDCLHRKERDCKVKEALDKHKLSKESYDNYVKLLEELQEDIKPWNQTKLS